MKKTICLIGCFMALSGCDTKPDYVLGKTAQCNKDTGIVFCKDNNGKDIDGVVGVYNESGKLTNIFGVEKGVQNGSFKSFFDNGKISQKYEVKNGKVHGLYTEYYQNGKKIKEEQWKNGEKHGIHKQFFENGNLQRKTEYKNNKENGDRIVYYENGKVNIVVSYKDDVATTPIKLFYENGKPKGEIERQKDGKIDGYARLFYENGNKQAEHFYKEGKLDGDIKNYYESGKLETEETYDKGVLKNKVAYEYDTDGSLLYKVLSDEKKETGIEYKGEKITRKQLDAKLKEKKLLEDIADCEQAVKKATEAKNSMPQDGVRVFQNGVVIWYDGLMTTGDYALLDEKGEIVFGISGRYRVVDFARDGVFVESGRRRYFVYTNDTDYATGQYFKPKNVIYKQSGNYKYSNMFGGTQSVPAYRATNYKISSINPKTYLKDKTLSCCQYVDRKSKGFKEVGIAINSFSKTKGTLTSNSAEGCGTVNHLKGYSGQEVIFTGTDY